MNPKIKHCYVYNLNLLIISHQVHVSFPPRNGCLQREKYPNNTHLPYKARFVVWNSHQKTCATMRLDYVCHNLLTNLGSVVNIVGERPICNMTT